MLLLQIISNVLGVAYFAAWSFSFYPQFFLNFRRKSVVGLSFDFQLYNLVGFVYYSIYCIINYFKLVSDPLHINVSDIFFAVHASIITALTCIQILIYDRGCQKVSKLCWSLTVCFLVVPSLIFFTPLTMTKILGSVKLFISFIKYTPQIYLNYKRKSTKGFHIVNIILDSTGAFLSFAQMVVDAVIEDNWNVFRNFTKLGLSFQSVFFDIIILVQHFVLYRGNAPVDDCNQEKNSETDPLV
ncbi:hypothetical protein GEMRC1_007406 [Eukaryota sp. GEM-RC1]